MTWQAKADLHTNFPSVFLELEFSGLENLLHDGNLESWNSLTDLKYWEENQKYGSSVNKESISVYSGLYCARLDVMAADEDVYIGQSFNLNPNKKYRLRFYYKNSASGENAKIFLGDAGENYSLKSDATWGAGWNAIVLDNSTDWIKYEIDFYPHPDYSAYKLRLCAEYETCLGSSVYYDLVSLGEFMRRYSFDYIRPESLAATKANILSLSRIYNSVGDIARTHEASNVVVEFSDTKYEFRELMETEGKNVIGRIKQGFIDDDIAYVLTVFTGQIVDWEPLKDLKFRIELEQKSKNMENLYPEIIVTRADFPYVHESALSKSVYIPFGNISAQGLTNDGAHPTLFVKTTVDSEQHLVGASIGGQIKINRVYINKVLKTPGAHWVSFSQAKQTITGQAATLYGIQWQAGVRPTANDDVTCDIDFKGIENPWEEVEDTPENTIYCFCKFGNYFYGGTGNNGKIYRSANGLDWTEVEDLADTIVYCLCVFDGYLYAGTSPYGKIYRSANGEDWNEVEDLTEAYISCMVVFDGYLYAGTYSSGKIFRTSNGTDWAEVADFAEARVADMIVFNDYLYAGTIDAAGGSVYRSANGTDWAEAKDFGAESIWGLGIFKNYIYAGVGTTGKIYRSANGIDWTMVKDTPDSYIYCFSEYRNYLFAGGDGKIYCSYDGETWIQAYSTGETSIQALGVFDGFIYAGSGTGAKIFRTEIWNQPVRALRKILENFCGYSSAEDFHETSYNTARTIEDSEGYTFDGMIEEQKKLKTFLDEFRNEYELDAWIDPKDGKIHFEYLLSASGTGRPHYRDSLDILSEYKEESRLETLLNYLDYSFNYNYAKKNFYSNNYEQDISSQEKHRQIATSFFGFKWIRQSSVAQKIAQRKITKFKEPKVFVTLPFPLKTFSLNLADTIKITHFDGRGSSGYSEKLFQIRSMELDLDNFINIMKLEDINELIS